MAKAKKQATEHTSDQDMGTLSSTALDGYLTAIVIGPGLVMPGEWLEGLWDNDPAFDGIEDAQKALNAIMLHYNGVLRRLETPETYRPYGFPKDPTHPDVVVWAAQWVQGFERAIKLRGADWVAMMRNEDARFLLAPILVFVEHEEKPVIDVPPTELPNVRLQAAALIPEVVPFIKEYWDDAGEYGVDAGKYGSASSEHPFSHRSTRVGRNDPCPCGSSQKYKRCCGATRATK